jgi:hypothetical protein
MRAATIGVFVAAMLVSTVGLSGSTAPSARSASGAQTSASK